MRILMICPQFRPLIGGYECVADRLSTALAQRGWQVTVLTERRDRRWPAVELRNGYEVRRLPCFYQRHLHMITILLALVIYLLRYGRSFDIWHVHSCGWHAGLAIAFGKLLRRPVVFKLISSGAFSVSQTMKKGIAGKMLAALHRRGSACLVASEDMHKDARCFGMPEKRIYRILPPIDEKQFYPVSQEKSIALRHSLGLNSKWLVIYVGRLSPEKNPLGLLDAWMAIDTKVRSRAMLALVGDGPEFDKVNTKIQKLNLKDSVYLAGGHSDVATWYQAADVFVLPSKTEGFSNSLLEALSCGLAVVSTRVSGSVDVIGVRNAGMLVSVDDMPAFGKAIEVLLSDEERRLVCGKNSRLYAKQNLSMESFLQKIESAYSVSRNTL